MSGWEDRWVPNFLGPALSWHVSGTIINGDLNSRRRDKVDQDANAPAPSYKASKRIQGDKRGKCDIQVDSNEQNELAVQFESPHFPLSLRGSVYWEMDCPTKRQKTLEEILAHKSGPPHRIPIPNNTQCFQSKLAFNLYHSDTDAQYRMIIPSDTNATRVLQPVILSVLKKKHG